MLQTHQVSAKLPKIERGMISALKQVVHALVLDHSLIERVVVSNRDHVLGVPVPGVENPAVFDVVGVLPANPVEVAGKAGTSFDFAVPLAVNRGRVHRKPGGIEVVAAGKNEQENEIFAHWGSFSLILPPRRNLENHASTFSVAT